MKKNFVLDTNVLLHEPAVLRGFKDHHITISSIVLQELDHLKSQNNPISRDAREVIRLLDKIVGDADHLAITKTGVVRNDIGGLVFIGKLSGNTGKPSECEISNDQRIINDALSIMEHSKENVIFVSKDVNARFLARAAGLTAQDYLASNIYHKSKLGKELVEEISHTSIVELAFSKIEHIDTEIEVETAGDRILYTMNVEDVKTATGVVPHPLQTLVTSKVADDDDINCYIVRELYDDKILMECTKLFATGNMPWGVESKNAEQDIALRFLTDPTIPCVVLNGLAGSGKTYLALAAGLEQVASKKTYTKMIITTAASDLTESIGFLPGTEEEKMLPWLGAFTDNLEVLLTDPDDNNEKREMTIATTASRYMQFKSINFMRGRSFQQTFIIVDEAQNLTPHQIKTLITRVGEGSKIILLGDLHQIDNPFLTRHSSGLTHVIENMRDSELVAHIELKGSPRSELAEDAANRL